MSSRTTLYNKEGLIEVFETNSQNLTHRAPYRKQNTAEALTRIDFPVAAVMIKSNWLNERRARELGIHNDADNPYITMEINSPVTDNNGKILEKGIHYLVAFHISSKDIPNWVWATFEHVDNPGRCDYIGCNDSYGYSSPDVIEPGERDNYTRPHTRSDSLLIPTPIFDTGKKYAGGTRSQDLAMVFKQSGIGGTKEKNHMPRSTDRGWLSYRLKGSQVEFTDAMGRPGIVGNSITEGGFVNSSSCMGCHARAAVNDQANPPLGVFVPQLSDVGYAKSHHGTPDPDWYHASGMPPSLIGLQTDFVWGFLLYPTTAQAAEIVPPRDGIV